MRRTTVQLEVLPSRLPWVGSEADALKDITDVRDQGPGAPWATVDRSPVLRHGGFRFDARSRKLRLHEAVQRIRLHPPSLAVEVEPVGTGAAAPPRSTRRQLSLYVPREVAAPLEAVRERVDPVQRALIPAHVTLCREDELTPLTLPTLERLVAHAALAPLTLRFGPPVPFLGHGILLEAVEGVAAYQALRAQVLGRTDLRAPRPHLTLAHPRNPRAPGDTLAAASQLPAGLSFTFDTLRLIEQAEGRPWRVLQVFPLRG